MHSYASSPGYLAVALVLLACGQPTAQGPAVTAPPEPPSPPVSSAPATPPPAPGGSTAAGPTRPPAATGSVPAGSTPTATPTASATSTTGAAALVGSWSSASCGTRGYVRRLALREDGGFEVEDRISPCPPDVKCIWSGISYTRGRWSREGAAIRLTVTAPGRGTEKNPVPTTLQVDPASGAPVEAGGGARCVYTRS